MCRWDSKLISHMIIMLHYYNYDDMIDFRQPSVYQCLRAYKVCTVVNCHSTGCYDSAERRSAVMCWLWGILAMNNAW